MFEFILVRNYNSDIFHRRINGNLYIRKKGQIENESLSSSLQNVDTPKFPEEVPLNLIRFNFRTKLTAKVQS